MKITYLLLKGFKRFKLANIKELELDINNPVTIITATNGYGKTSLMKELSPLPPVRTDFEKDGYKELRITHENDYFILASDFNNRTSPHSFKINGVEMNVGGTTDIQEELCLKYFGINNVIRNIIYGKVKVCQLTKADRKNLFLNINPMDLSLILNTYKSALTKFREAKSQLQHLYSRKSDIESKMIPDDTLSEHVKTKAKLDELETQCDVAVKEYANHVSRLKSEYSDYLTYFKNCNTDLLTEIPKQCKVLSRKIIKYAKVARGDEFTRKQENISVNLSTAVSKRYELTSAINKLTEEMDEYRKHLDDCSNRPISTLESEISKLDYWIKELSVTITTPIPVTQIDHVKKLYTDELIELLNSFDGITFELITPEEYAKATIDLSNLKYQLNLAKASVAACQENVTRLKTDIASYTDKANVPDTCQFENCGLRKLYTRRKENLDVEYFNATAKLESTAKQYAALEASYTRLDAELKPYTESNVYGKLDKLTRILSDNVFTSIVPDDLLACVKTPTKLLFSIRDYIQDSEAYHRRAKLLVEKEKLEAELKTIISNTNINVDFINSKINQSKVELNNKLTELTELSNHILELTSDKELYVEYANDVNELNKLVISYNRYSKGLTISKAIDYWIAQYRMTKMALDKLRMDKASLANLVKEQDILRNTYKSEILDQIAKIEKDKNIYDLLQTALSPTDGLIHKSMVKYLNNVINNANYFISQIWSYHMKILKVNEEQAIDYSFKIEIENDVVSDIGLLSDGQLEVVNLAFVLTILLQLKMLNKIPFFADEIGRTMDSNHRMKLLKFITHIVDTELVEQLFIINHFALFTDGFQDANTVCLSPETMNDLPTSVNANTKIQYM